MQVQEVEAMLKSLVAGQSEKVHIKKRLELQ